MCVEVLCIPKGVTCSYQVNSMCTRSLYQTQQDLTYSSCFFSCRFQFPPASPPFSGIEPSWEKVSQTVFVVKLRLIYTRANSGGQLALFHTMGDCWALSHFFESVYIRFQRFSGFFPPIYTTFTLCCTYQSFDLGLFKHSSVSCSVGLRGFFWLSDLMFPKREKSI